VHALLLLPRPFDSYLVGEMVGIAKHWAEWIPMRPAG
jgi:hypothetical protein